MNDLFPRSRNAYRIGKLVTLVLLIVAAAAGASQLDRHTPPPRPPPDPPTTITALPSTVPTRTPAATNVKPHRPPTSDVTLNLTYTEWADLSSCLHQTRLYISDTLDLHGDLFEPGEMMHVTRALDRLGHLITVVDADHVGAMPDEAFQAALDRADNLKQALNAVNLVNDAAVLLYATEHLSCTLPPQ